MKNLSISLMASMLVVSAAFGCPVTFINDTDATVFAFDENHNEGHMIAAGNQHLYGDNTRHPVVTFYTLLPDGNTFKKMYRVIQTNCAAMASDKLVKLSAVQKDELSKEVFEIMNFEANPEVLPCCMHEGKRRGTEAVVDQPLSTTDEE